MLASPRASSSSLRAPQLPLLAAANTALQASWEPLARTALASPLASSSRDSTSRRSPPTAQKTLPASTVAPAWSSRRTTSRCPPFMAAARCDSPSPEASLGSAPASSSRPSAPALLPCTAVATPWPRSSSRPASSSSTPRASVPPSASTAASSGESVLLHRAPVCFHRESSAVGQARASRSCRRASPRFCRAASRATDSPEAVHLLTSPLASSSARRAPQAPASAASATGVRPSCRVVARLGSARASRKRPTTSAWSRWAASSVGQSPPASASRSGSAPPSSSSPATPCRAAGAPPPSSA
mmetsp:Transcript_103697/g.274159  ORF Transcript_103697/g.274159 Transcript_103697/m.274159 type:complete len:300 (+) Transcript_103697:770-1669(+)